MLAYAPESSSGSRRSLRILIADDNKDDVLTLGALLWDEGHEVRGVYRGDAVSDVVAAFAPDAVRERLLALPLDRVTPHTIIDRKQLEAQLEAVRTAGVAGTNEELEVGLDAVAAPVFGADGEVLAALDVSGPSHRLRERHDLDRLTKEGAADLSRRLGYRPRRAET